MSSLTTGSGLQDFNRSFMANPIVIDKFGINSTQDWTSEKKK